MRKLMLVILITLVTGCTGINSERTILLTQQAALRPSLPETLSTQYIDKAKDLLAKGGYSGDPFFVYDRTEQGYEFFYLTVYSDDFSKLSQDSIASFLHTLYYLKDENPDADLPGYWINVKVVSNGNEYSYEQNALWKNGEHWYKEESSGSSSKDTSSDSSSSSSSVNCDTLWNNLDIANQLSGGEVTDLTMYYTEQIVKYCLP